MAFIATTHTMPPSNIFVQAFEETVPETQPFRYLLRNLIENDDAMAKPIGTFIRSLVFVYRAVLVRRKSNVPWYSKAAFEQNEDGTLLRRFPDASNVTAECISVALLLNKDAPTNDVLATAVMKLFIDATIADVTPEQRRELERLEPLDAFSLVLFGATVFLFVQAHLQGEATHIFASIGVQARYRRIMAKFMAKEGILLLIEGLMNDFQPR